MTGLRTTRDQAPRDGAAADTSNGNTSSGDTASADTTTGAQTGTDTAGTGGREDRWFDTSQWARVAVTAVVIVPFLTAVARAIRRDWFPIGDNALLFIRTRDVWTEDHPLLGSWTSASLSVGENMNNPGAMYDWLVAPFAHLLSPGPAAAMPPAAPRATHPPVPAPRAAAGSPAPPCGTPPRA